jgi:hypothetical protein
VKKAVRTMRGKKMKMITMNSKMKMMITKVCLLTTFYSRPMTYFPTK